MKSQVSLFLAFCCTYFNLLSECFCPGQAGLLRLRLAPASSKKDGYFHSNVLLSATSSGKPKGRTKRGPQFIRPELIVVDLDNTLWTPELYQLNPKKGTPQAKKDIHLFSDVPAILQLTLAEDYPPHQKAIASRAQNKDWALQLLHDFRISSQGKKPTLHELFHPHVEIRGGTKKQHFQALRESTGVSYNNMIFFDDWDENLEDVSQLGVLSCHCPVGLTMDIFQGSLQFYHELKEQDKDNWMGYVI